MKKIISCITIISLLLSFASISVYADEVSLDPMNNVLFDVVSQIKDVDTDDGHNHGELIDMYVISNYPGATLIKLFEDGCRISKKVLDSDEYRGKIYLADTQFPAYLDKVSDSKFILEEEGSADGESMKWYYLVDISQDVITSDLIATSLSTLSMDTNERVYTITLFTKDASGQEIETVVDGSPMSYDDYWEFVYGGSRFDDGLTYKSSYSDDVSNSGYYNINGECVWQDPHFSYYSMGYSLGYFIENFNNGGSLDWSQEDVYNQMRYSTNLINSVTNQKYFFDNTNISYIFDNGYAIMDVKDDAGNNLEYVIKLKIPAIPTVHLNGKKIRFDQIPVIENGRTLVPLRAIFEALGAVVSWDEATNTVTASRDNTEIKLTINSSNAYKNGELITLDVPAKLQNGRTLVPVRFVADSFGVDVKWVQEDLKVVLTEK